VRQRVARRDIIVAVALVGQEGNQLRSSKGEGPSGQQRAPLDPQMPGPSAQVSRTLARSAPPSSSRGGGGGGAAAATSSRSTDQADVDLFELIDRNEDGMLSQEEFDRFRQGYCDRPDPTRGQLFKLVDQNGNGVITPAEFRQFFVAADLDGNGFISRSKFAHYEQVVAPIVAPTEPERPWDCQHNRSVREQATHTPANSEVLALLEGLLEGFREAAATASPPPQQQPGRSDGTAIAPAFGGRPAGQAPSNAGYTPPSRAGLSSSRGAAAPQGAWPAGEDPGGGDRATAGGGRGGGAAEGRQVPTFGASARA